MILYSTEVLFLIFLIFLEINIFLTLMKNIIYILKKYLELQKYMNLIKNLLNFLIFLLFFIQLIHMKITN